jgi:hypothetical protein
MALSLYHAPSPNAKIDSDSPLTLTFDGRVPAAQQRLVYLRNDDVAKWYNDVHLSIPSPMANIVWKFKESDFSPSEEAWALIAANNTLSLTESVGSMGNPNTDTFFPVWIRIQTEKKLKIQTLINFPLSLQATEFDITDNGEE